MSKRVITSVVVAGLMLPFAALATSASADTYKAAYADAQAAHAKVVAADNQWKTTVDTLAAAEKAAKEQHYDKATELAQKAEELAQLALQQDKKQQKVWKNMVPQ